MSKCGIRMSKCFWCGKEDGIIIPKKLSKDADSYCPPIVVSFEPCKTCEENFKKGVLLIEASETPLYENQMPITEKGYPTGNHWVVAENVFGKDIQKGDRQLITKEIAEQMGLYAIQSE